MPGSRVRLEVPIPAERVPRGETTQPAATPFGSTGSTPGTVVPGSGSGVLTGSLFLIPGVGSFTHVTSGNPIVIKDLGAVNTHFTPYCYNYPGGAGDKNDSQWIKGLPSDAAAVPNIRIRIHFLGD